MLKRFVSLALLGLFPITSLGAEGDGDAKLAGLLADPNATISSIELSPYRGPRYFVGGTFGLITSDPNRLINGYDGKQANNYLVGGRLGVDYSPRLALKVDWNWYQFTADNGYTAYSIHTVTGGAQINLVRSRGLVPYVRVMSGVAYTRRDLSDQFSSTDNSITKGNDTSTLLDIGLGLMYDSAKTWLADGDVRLLGEFTTRRDNNDKATPVTFFQEGIINLSAEYLFGSSVFFGQKIVIEREVTSDEGDGSKGLFREKREPVLYPSAADLAVLSDTSQPGIVFFRHYSSYIVDTQKAKLDAMVEQLEQNPNAQAVITGHSDTNSFIYDRIEQLRFNRAISAKRAVAVYNYLVSGGIDPERVTLQWRAAQQLASKEDSPVGRSYNRRAQVQIR